MKAVHLPPSVQEALDALRRRLYAGRVLWSLGLFFLAAGLLVAGALVADLVFGLGTPHLRLALSLVVATGLAFCFGGMVLPLLRPTRPEMLAALLEKHHPHLAERFTSLLHLPARPVPGHGSPEFMAALAAQAADACSTLDLARAYRLQPARWIMSTGAMVLLALMLPAAFVGEYQTFLGRFFGSFAAPWHGFTLAVEPGTHPFAAGQPITIRARLEAHHPSGRLPGECWLVVRDETGEEMRHAMKPEPDGFSSVLGGIERPATYRVEADGLVSEEYQLLPVAPIFVVEGGMEVRIAPPPYIKGEAAKLPALGRIAGKQYGSLALSLSLNRAPKRIQIVWKDDDGKEVILPGETKFIESRPHAEGSWLLPAAGNFTGALLLEGEHGICFRHALPALEVSADGPPRVSLQMSRTGPSATLTVRPGDHIPFWVEAHDEEGLQELAWEYRLGGKQGQRQISAPRGKTSFAEDVTFQVPRGAKIGEQLELRLRVVDNRGVKKGSLGTWNGAALPVDDVGPHVVFEPTAKEWLSFLIQKVDPWREREILAQRDEMDLLLKALVKKVEALRADVGSLRSSSHHLPTLRPDQQKRRENLVETNQDLRLEMLLLAGKAEKALDPLAQRLEAVANKEMKQSEAALEGASKAGAETRDHAFHQAEGDLLEAIRKLQGLFKLNDALAKERLDRLELGELAEKESGLADKAAKMAKGGGGEDDLQKEQDDIRHKLEELIKASPFLAGLFKDMDKERAETTIKSLEELARHAREPEADPLSLTKERQGILDELIRLQTELAGRVDVWQKGDAERIEQARQAAEAMLKGLWHGALVQQKEAEAGLRFAAERLESGGKGGLREKVLRMAREQEALSKELIELGEDLPRLNAEDLKRRIDKIGKAQRDLARDLAALKFPAKAEGAHAEALAMLEGILDRQARKDFLGAFLKMEEAPDLLTGLARMIPEAFREPGKEIVVPPEMKAKAKAGRSLEEEQRALRLRLEKLLAEAAREGDKARAAKAAAMEDKADRLADDLLKLAQKMEGVPGKGKMEEAAKLAGEAKMAFEKIEKAPDKATPEMEKEASLKLEMAGKLARAAADEMKAGRPKDDFSRNPEMAKGVEEGKKNVEAAGMELKKGDLAGAAKSMSRAAEALKSAAREPKAGKRAAAASKTPGKTPGSVAPAPHVSAKISDKALEKFLGKAWGDLPGEVRAQVILELQQRFGEEYQPIIQRYFENLARERKR